MSEGERLLPALAVADVKRWDFACPDWEERLRKGLPLVPKLPIDEVVGERAVRVFNKLRLHDVPTTPALKDAGGDWFREIIRALFGSLDPATGERAIREVFLLVPKKNSKTTYGALLMLTALLLNTRPHAPFIMTAPVQDTADLAFSAAAGAIRLDEVLSKKLHIREHVKTIVHRETKAELQIMTFDPSVLTGQKVVGVLIDELHVVAKKAKASSAIRQLRGGMLPFPEAFMAFITTQSEDAPSGVFKAELNKARAIRDGRQDGAMLPVLYEFPESMQKDEPPGSGAWRDPKNWSLVTPNAGRSVSIERLVEEYNEAEKKGIDELKEWASQHLDVEIGLALRSDSWTGALFWEEQAEESVTLDEILKRCEVIDVGIDGGGLDDLLGLSVVGREENADREKARWLSWSRAWVHPIALDRRKEIAPRLRDFEKDGDLKIVSNVGEDLAELAKIVARIYKAGLLDKVGVDPAGIGAILDALAAEGIKNDLVVGIPQGWKLHGTIQTMERKLAAGQLVHGGRPLMAWALSNAKVEQKGNAVLITKAASGVGKIDPLMALLDAVALMALNPKSKKNQYKMMIL